MSEGTRTRPRFEMEHCHSHHTVLVKAGHKANTNSTSLFHFLMGGTSSDVVTRAGMEMGKWETDLALFLVNMQVSMQLPFLIRNLYKYLFN